MKRHIIALFSAIALVLGLSLTPVAAYADGSCSGVDMMTGTGGNCSDQVGGDSSAQASTHVTATTANGVNIKSSTHVVSYIQAKGATQAQMHGKHYRLKHGRSMWTSYKNIYGQEVWHWKWYPKGHLFVKGGDGYWHDTVCWNKVVGIPHGKKHVGKKVYGSIKIVQRFVFKSSATASVSDHVKASSSVWVNTYDQQGNQYCHSDATATGEASFYAEASDTVKGSVLSKVRESAKERAQGNLSVKLEGKSLIEVHANTAATASGRATAHAAVNVHCSQAPNTRPAQAPTVSIGGKNQVGAGEHATVCADYNVSGNDSATLKFGSNLGSYPAGLGGDTFTVSGMGTQCTEYQAPNDADQPPSDTLSVTVRDNQTGLSASDSTPITITYSSTPM